MNPTDPWHLHVSQIREQVVPGRRLGRHVKHDSRSLRFPFKAGPVPLRDCRWSSVVTPVLDQGDVGCCTGNATVAALLCNPFFLTFDNERIATLSEELALKIYTRATQTDGFDGEYPLQDTGSDGLDVAKAAVEFGYINGYSHAFGLNDALAALQFGPVIVGVNWYEGFDAPDALGQMDKAGNARGGHEVCIDQIDVQNKRVWIRNSWGREWACQGRAFWTWDTFGQLLDEQGDVTVLNPLTVSPPTPVPAPTPVVPVPVPVPPVQPVTSDPAKVLIEVARPWAQHKKFNAGNERLRQALIPWLAAQPAEQPADPGQN